MRSTLFYIPHADPIFEIPLFGWGSLVVLLLIGVVILLVVRLRREGWRREVLRDLPLYLVLAVALVWGAPLVEERTAAGVPLGIPIRAYGVMVLAGIVTSVGLLVHESRRMGLHPDQILSLVFWMVLSGFVGARVFYVIQYWPQFSAPSWGATLASILKLTDGGLVVYGSFLAVLPAVLLFVRQNRLPLLALADLLAPSLMLGLACGRIGCFLNGCCWGMPCDQGALAVTFPQGSPPFVDQLKEGTLLDMQLEPLPEEGSRVAGIQPGGRAERAGLQVGDLVQHLALPDENAFNRLRHGEAADDAVVAVQLADGRFVSWRFGELPRRSAPVYPVQILSSINAALIGLFLWSYYPFRRHDGAVLALLLSIYPATRILLEMIRRDEPGVWDLPFRFTISQTISAALLLGAVALWAYLLRQPVGSALPRRADA